VVLTAALVVMPHLVTQHVVSTVAVDVSIDGPILTSINRHPNIFLPLPFRPCTIYRINKPVFQKRYTPIIEIYFR
jgi:hypothetical protein